MDKHQALHRLLERTSRATADIRPHERCLDAETLAAWMDDSLTSTQRIAAETHAADCDRCLAVLAAIAKISPPPSVTTGRKWLPIRWLVPLTTAAVGITAWVVVRSPEAPSLPVGQSTIDTVKPADPPAPSEPDASPRASANALQDKPAVPPPLSRSSDQVQPRRPAAPPRKDSAAASAQPTAKGQAPAPASEARVESSTSVAAASPLVITPPPRREASDARLQSSVRGNLQSWRAIASPDPDVQWRIAGPSVERSTDGGRTWRPQPSGTVDDLLAGASPAPTVCWIVGRNGLVLLSTDGQSWQTLDFPIATVDLVAVSARDGVAAAVTTADGRTYRTTDAGRTWTLQEIPATPF